MRDLARQELERAPRGLVVVEDPGAREHAVATPVRAGAEMRVGLGNAVWSQRGEWGRLRLRNLPRLAEDLRGRRLVEADCGVDRSNRLEQRGRANSRELRRLHGP